jgi:DNA polymerase III sliding clamp (beta) subunit (PCNA family)
MSSKKISFRAEDWARVFDNASSATSKEVSKPELNLAAVEVKPKDLEVIITTTDGEIEYRENVSIISCDVGESHSFYVPVELFKAALKNSVGTATLDISEKKSYYKCGPLRVALPYITKIDVTYLSSFDESELKPLYIGPLEEFAKAAAGAAWLVPNRTPNEALRGLLMHIEGEGEHPGLTFVGSDGIGLVAVPVKHDWVTGDDFDATLTTKIVSAVTSTKTTSKGPRIEVLASDYLNWALFKIYDGDTNIEIRGLKLNSKYPDWRKFLNAAVLKEGNEVTIDAKKLSDEINKLNMLSMAQGAMFARFELRFFEDQVNFEAISTASEIKDALELVTSKLESEEYFTRTFCIDTGIMARFLASIKKSQVVLMFNSSMSPVAVIAEDFYEDTTKHQFVMMPCRK